MHRGIAGEDTYIDKKYFKMQNTNFKFQIYNLQFASILKAKNKFTYPLTPVSSTGQALTLSHKGRGDSKIPPPLRGGGEGEGELCNFI
ncbi:MAG: hypothetical protein AAB012_04415 [Nitrospirota bacterium]